VNLRGGGGECDSPDASDQKSREEEAGQSKARKLLNFFRIPKDDKNMAWTDEQLSNFKKNWPHLKNFDDSVLRCATLDRTDCYGKTKMFRG
jgi:hypothetical protein